MNPSVLGRESYIAGQRYATEGHLWGCAGYYQDSPVLPQQPLSFQARWYIASGWTRAGNRACHIHPAISQRVRHDEASIAILSFLDPRTTIGPSPSHLASLASLSLLRSVDWPMKMSSIRTSWSVTRRSRTIA